jgi:hypothetical protein
MRCAFGLAAMTETRVPEQLIGRLVGDLRPVRRLRSPAVRAALWLGLVAGVALGFAVSVPLAPIARRLSDAPDMWLAAAGSVLTAILAALAAFELSLPDRRRAWALLPLPAAALWIGASGLGCLRTSVVSDAHEPVFHETLHCLVFIGGFSIPLSAWLLMMLRRARPLRGGLATATAGLASAAAAASLLWFVHPFDASALDLAVHIVAIGLVITLNWYAGGLVIGAER